MRAVDRPGRRALVLLVALTLAAGCSSSGGGGEAHGVGGRVAILGDSITVLGQARIRQIADGYRFKVDARIGATAEDMRSKVADLVRKHPRQVIVNLGTNDILQGLNPDDAVSTIGDIVGKFDAASCVHLVTVNEEMVAPAVPDLAARARRLNAGLRKLAGEHARVSIIDWNGLVADYVRAGQPDGQLTTDSVHPSDVGKSKLARTYRNALNACPAADPATTPVAGSTS